MRTSLPGRVLRVRRDGRDPESDSHSDVQEDVEEGHDAEEDVFCGDDELRLPVVPKGTVGSRRTFVAKGESVPSTTDCAS